jgi:RNA polymerase sigma factor (TIGR02999 family)
MGTAETEERRDFDRLFGLLYNELRRSARGILRDDRNVTLTPTALVNEAWLKLARYPDVAKTTPLHFKHIAGRAMRQVLVEAARRREAQSRGGGKPLVTLDDSIPHLAIAGSKEMLALDSALEELSHVAPRQASLVEGRFFGGLDVAESAANLGVSESTVMREWRAARAWLAVEIRRSLAAPPNAPSGHRHSKTQSGWDAP